MKPLFKLVFTKEAHDAMMGLAHKAGTKSVKDAVQKSCAVLDYLLEQQAAGNSIVIEYQDGTREPFEIK